ncbi:hypothetical protein [Streptomyces sp. NPDC060198]|uniref:hypothetical protein n=1 Tax=Streptomyces sp. NPDC060198 TaxID=3347070 RepID=UPI0036671003
MFGLTTRRRLRDEVDAHLHTIRRLVSTESQAEESRRLLHEEIDAHIVAICARRTAEDTLAAHQAAAAEVRPVEHSDELWSLIDWTLWGSGLGDTFRERLADTFLQAITPDDHAQALELIRWWTEDRGREPLGRRRYEDLNRRLSRALDNVVRWRKAAHDEKAITRRLADQLLSSASGQSTAARRALGLSDLAPWERAVEGLNALVDASIPVHIEPDGHISNPTGDEHIEWDQTAKRWRLVHDEDDLDTATMDGTR